MVSRGDGTRRITIKLSPEALGDVRVVLTVRHGDVHVRMTGSEQAQQALRSGAPELHRLLDLAGASSTSVVVGDQGTSPDAGMNARSAAATSERYTLRPGGHPCPCGPPKSGCRKTPSAAAVAVSPVPAVAQYDNAANTADAANVAAPAPADANMTAADVNAAVAEAPPADIAVANDAAVEPAPAPRSRPFPWGVIGLIGLVGLLGRRSS